jgi:hypothetical protein
MSAAAGPAPDADAHQQAAHPAYDRPLAGIAPPLHSPRAVPRATAAADMFLSSKPVHRPAAAVRNHPASQCLLLCCTPCWAASCAESSSHRNGDLGNAVALIRAKTTAVVMKTQERRAAVLQGRKVRTKQIDVGEVAALNREAVRENNPTDLRKSISFCQASSPHCAQSVCAHEEALK